MKNIKMTTQTFMKKPGFKTVYELVETEIELIDIKTVKAIENDCRYFRQLGYSKTATKTYTDHGFNLVKLISKRTDGKKTIQIFEYLFN